MRSVRNGFEGGGEGSEGTCWVEVASPDRGDDAEDLRGDEVAVGDYGGVTVGGGCGGGEVDYQVGYWGDWVGYRRGGG